MTMRSKTKIKIPLSSTFRRLNPSTILFCCVVWLQILNSFPVLCESDGFFVQPAYQSVSPEMYHFLSPQRPHIQNVKAKLNGESVQAESIGKSADIADHHTSGELLSTGLLLAKQFPKSSYPMIFNQANGPFMGKDPSEGLFATYDYDFLPPKQVVVRSRSPPGHFIINPGGPPVKRSQSLAAAREGYMCHFKLCQFGSSGKRRWSPLFEFD